MSQLTTAHFAQALREHKLIGSRSRSTGELFVPPRPFSPKNFQDDMELVELTGRGTLLAFTIVYVGTSAMVSAGYNRQNPYCVGVVQLAEGAKISAQILGVDVLHPEQIQIGMPLKATFIERGEGEAKKTFLAFEPAD
jgi:hypothetical protein